MHTYKNEFEIIPTSNKATATGVTGGDKEENLNDIQLIPSYWASVSGGKDSLFMLKLLLDNPDKYKLDGVIHFELEIDYPFIKNVVRLMRAECYKRGIKFVSIKPRKSWFDLYKKRGMPIRRVRWCNSEYKLDALKQLKEYLRTQNQYVVSYIGYCWDEVKRYEHRGIEKNELYPLVDFGINEDIILKWAQTQPVFNDYYKYNKRCGCMYCPLASHQNLLYLKKYYPEQFNTFMSMASETEKRREKELGRPFSIWQSNPKYNTEYLIKKLSEKELKPL